MTVMEFMRTAFLAIEGTKMNMRTRIVWVLFVIITFYVAPVSAGIIEIGVTWEISYVTDFLNVLNGQFSPGDTVTGSYIYDSDTVDSAPSSEREGIYEHNSSSYGVSLSVNGFTFQTDLDNMDFRVAVLNYDPPPLGAWEFDGFVVHSFNNLPFNEDVFIDTIRWELRDSTATALSGIDLPLTPPVLEDYETSWKDLDIQAVTYDGSGWPISAFNIYAETTSVEIVPEPATIFLLTLGGLALRRKRRPN